MNSSKTKWKKKASMIKTSYLASISNVFPLSKFQVGAVVVPIIGDSIYSISTLQCLLNGLLITQIGLLFKFRDQLVSKLNILLKETYRNDFSALQGQGFGTSLRNVARNCSNVKFASCAVRQKTADDRPTLLSSCPKNDDYLLGHIHGLQN